MLSAISIKTVVSERQMSYMDSKLKTGKRKIPEHSGAGTGLE